MGRGLLVLAILAVLRLTPSGQTLPAPYDAAPQLDQHRIEHLAEKLYVGTPFHLELRVTAVAGVRWTHPPLPLRRDGLTWRSVTIRPLDAGRYEIVLELQAFRTGNVPIGSLPLQAEYPSSEKYPLPWPDLTVAVERLTAAAGPGPPRPRPPRVILNLPESGGLMYLVPALGLVLGLILLLVWWRRRQTPVEISPARIPENHDMDHFLQILDGLWARREQLGDDRLLAFGLMATFRDYLSWRFDRDFLPLTNQEIVAFLDDHFPANSPALRQLAGVLDEGDLIRFSPDGGVPFSLFSAVRELMTRLGEKSDREAADGGAEIT
ncbi:MAG: hypothetical protein JXQ27_14260 [Acidobacteria bacterium]|nr:hypothetical protein [Acidobacteriota bacterium]